MAAKRKTNFWGYFLNLIFLNEAFPLSIFRGDFDALAHNLPQDFEGNIEVKYYQESLGYSVG